jgi:hypothetical protein
LDEPGHDFVPVVSVLTKANAGASGLLSSIHCIQNLRGKQWQIWKKILRIYQCMKMVNWLYAPLQQ